MKSAVKSHSGLRANEANGAETNCEELKEDEGLQEEEEEEEESTPDDNTFDTSVLLLPPSSSVSVSSSFESSQQDRYRVVYLVFFLLGIGNMLPWNFMISVTEFWTYKFRDVNNSLCASQNQSLNPLQENFFSFLAISSTVPNATFVILNVVFGQRFDYKKRLQGSLLIIMVVFVLITVLAEVNSDSWQMSFMVLVLCLVVVINASSAIFQGSIFGVAGKFPPEYMAAVMTGQAAGGIFPVLVYLAVTSINLSDDNIGAICFSIATVVLLVCLLAFNGVTKHPFFKLHVASSSGERYDTGNEAVLPDLRLIVSKCWPFAASLYLTFAVTLSVFPAMSMLVVSQYAGEAKLAWWADKYFLTVCCPLLFNVGDLVGRCLAGWIMWPKSDATGKALLIGFSIIRIGFIPLFMYCNLAPSNRHLPVFFGTDADFIAIMVMFSVSNGYLGNLCMIHGPKTLSRSVQQECAAMFLVACLVLGTGSGSFLSYPLIHAL